MEYTNRACADDHLKDPEEPSSIVYLGQLFP